MSSPPENRADIVFGEALDLPASERPRYIADACGTDTGLLGEVHALLDAHEAAPAGFLAEPAGVGVGADGPGATVKVDGTRTEQTAGALTEKQGDTIGPYKLLQEIGEGGFGSVWMAEQTEPITRKVALKVIKAGMDTKEVLARFEAERQALAMMEHPNIAKVLDAGATSTGRPYFAMELVKGIPITEYCDEAGLDIRGRLELFGDVCSAINHAHQKGIIHRDIKPTNVMVTLHGDRPVVKVIDFGIAKAVQGKLTERTLFTRFEQFVGTPVYMSPEQACLSGLDIDTRSDIYALGVLLYELLTGNTPFDTKSLVSAGYDEMRRIIREDDPPKPSSRLGTVSGKERTQIAKARRIEPEKLDRLVAPDIDWIVVKAIEKDRARRYETANALADDIGRFLNDEPVLAAAPSALYQFRKFARRHKTTIGVAAMVVVLLVGGITATTWQAMRATDEKNRAVEAEALAERRLGESESAREEAQAISNFLNDILKSPRPDTEGGGRNVRVVDLLGEAAKRLDDADAIFPDRVAELRADVATTFYHLGQFEESLGIREKVFRHYLDARGAEDPATIGSKMHLAVAYRAVGRSERALELHREVLESSRKVAGPQGLLTIQAMGNLAASYEATGKRQPALELREETLRLSEEELGEEHTETFYARYNLAQSYSSAGRQGEALELQEQAVALGQKLFAPDDPEALKARRELASFYEQAGRLKEAVAIREDILGKLVISTASEPGKTSQVLADFDSTDSGERWKTVNDNVMGGRSKGGPSFRDGLLVFAGETVTQGGGFSTIRIREAESIDLSFADAVQLRVKGDGRTYLFEMRTKAGLTPWNAVPYRAEFATKAGEWIEVSVPLDSLKPTMHGFNITGRSPALDKNDIRSFGLMIYDGKDGKFQLEVDWIKAVPTATEISSR